MSPNLPHIPLRFFIFFLVLVPFAAWSQKLDHRLGEIILQIEKGMHPKDISAPAFEFVPAGKPFQGASPILREFNIWLLRVDYRNHNEIEILNHLRHMPGVIHAQFNYLIEWRKAPNDPQYGLQWHWENTGQLGTPVDIDLQMEKTWEYSTGGITPDGDTIVACIIDGSFDRDHEDLAPNAWVNREEIPGNGIDDDNNGYIDDYYGWNVKEQNDNINGAGSHGTGVAGLLGAKGNNTKGITGINWDVQLMMISGISDIASVLQAYRYPLHMRKRYNKTHGAHGAFVVVVNASWGISNLYADDAPLWCAFYDSLGAAGILSCCAAPNRSINIDEAGDMPSNCSSPFLISVTNITSEDRWYSKSAYGPQTVDLGCFGQDTYSCSPNNAYRKFGGTSAATPIVSGAVALLYARGYCNNLSALAGRAPKEAARYAKNLILDYTHPLPSLKGRCTTGGRLDILRAIKHTTPFFLTGKTDSSVTLSWTGAEQELSAIEYRPVGSSVWNMTTGSIRRPYQLNGLAGCTSYELRTQDICTMDTALFRFETEGCCRRPEPVHLIAIDTSAVALSWPQIYAAKSFEALVTGPLPEDSTTMVFPIPLDTNGVYRIGGLLPCSEYAIGIRSICKDSTGQESKPVIIRTLGCGPCLDLSYCIPAFPPDATDDRVSYVHLNDSILPIPGSVSGYEMVPNQGFELSYCDSNTLIIRTAGTAAELLNAWIDYNQNGLFEDDEIILHTAIAGNSPFQSSFVLTREALPGVTRMRIALKWPGFDAHPPTDCGDNIEFGHVLDLCVSIKNTCLSPPPLPLLDTSTAAITIIRWDNCAPAGYYRLNYTLPDSNESAIITTKNYIVLPQLPKCLNLPARLYQICDTSVGQWSSPRKFLLRTKCKTAVNDISELNHKIHIHSNPTRRVILLYIPPSFRSGGWALINMEAKVLENGTLIPSPTGIQSLTLRKELSGLYFLRITTKERMVTKRIILL